MNYKLLKKEYIVRNVGIALLAFLGFVLCAIMIYQGQKKEKFEPVAPPPPSPPFVHFIAAQGLIESAYKNIPIGSSYSDVITEVFVNVGDFVKKGTCLFKTDTRLFEAQLKEALAQQAIAQKKYDNQLRQFSYYENLNDKSAVSKQEYTTAEYNKIIAFKELQEAQAAVQTYQTQIARSYVQAPIDGEVLQLNIRVGQNAIPEGRDDMPLILFGDSDYFHVRVDIDEEDSWRYVEGEQAIAFVRGTTSIRIPLEYVYIEPYIVPKRSLTGSDLQRVDTRVLQAVYRFKKHNLPVFIGELLDVYIQAKPHEVAS